MQGAGGDDRSLPTQTLLWLCICADTAKSTFWSWESGFLFGGRIRKNTTYGKWAQGKRNIETEQETKIKDWKMGNEKIHRAWVNMWGETFGRHVEGALAMDCVGFVTDWGPLESLVQSTICLSNGEQVTSSLQKEKIFLLKGCEVPLAVRMWHTDLVIADWERAGEWMISSN